MSIENFALIASVEKNIEKKIAALIKDGIVSGIEPNTPDYKIFFCMAIQFVPKLSKQQFSFGKPEGVRIFISTGQKVSAAIDFVFHKRGLKFSHIYQGKPLDQLVNMIKKLQQKYAGTAGKHYIELIQFFYLQSQFVLVKTGRKRLFFRYSGKKLTVYTFQDLKNEINSILKDPPLFDN